MKIPHFSNQQAPFVGGSARPPGLAAHDVPHAVGGAHQDRSAAGGRRTWPCRWRDGGQMGVETMGKMGDTWWLIPLSKWVITPVINGISRVNPLIIGVITHLLSGMSHQVNHEKPLNNGERHGVSPHFPPFSHGKYILNNGERHGNSDLLKHGCW